MSLADIQTRIAAAEVKAGRAAGSVRLIAVSKLQPLERVEAVLLGKWPDLRARFGPVEVHMIGPLQSNKARQALGLFDAIHSVDRASLAQKLASALQAGGRCPALFVQVNTGSEPQKAGVLPGDLDGFVARCRAMDLPVAGLMCIPPESEESTPHFAMLAAMAARNGLSGLSMGMSGDFEAAIAHGASHVRVGSAIFGARAIL
jgi:pyridoxal phosphate enzyme (YggS family)